MAYRKVEVASASLEPRLNGETTRPSLNGTRPFEKALQFYLSSPGFTSRPLNTRVSYANDLKGYGVSPRVLRETYIMQNKPTNADEVSRLLGITKSHASVYIPSSPYSIIQTSS